MGGNSIMERRIGGCRRELLDRTLVLNQRHLTIVLREYEDFYNAHRPRRALKQAAPPPRGFVPEAEQGRILAGVLAGIELGAWDRQIARWLAGWDTSTVLTVPSLIARARAAGLAGSGR
jgi:hypothetical protein